MQDFFLFPERGKRIVRERQRKTGGANFAMKREPASQKLILKIKLKF